MTVETILLVLLIILVLGSIPAWPYSRSWGYGPSGVLGAVLVILFLWLFLGNNQMSNDVGQDIKNGLQQTGQDIKSGVREAGSEIKEMGHDAKRAVQDAAD